MEASSTAGADPIGDARLRRIGDARAWLLRVAAMLVVLGAAADVRAQGARDPALAETLFQEGKSLMEAGQYAKACPKLQESERLDPATGTLLALALCHEAEGKTATAWTEFSEVAVAAKKDGRADRQKLARERVAALEPALSRLTLSVAKDAAVDGLEVKLDGLAVGSAAWDTAAPIDPGEHVVDATAPGHKPWTTKLVIGKRADKKTVTVPRLPDAETSADANPPEHADEAPLPPSHSSGTLKLDRRNVGIIVGAGGVVLLGIGTYFGLHALSQNSDAKKLCNPNDCGSQPAIDLNHSARTSATVANVTLALGLVAAAVGVYLFVTAPPAETSSALRDPGVVRF